MTGTNEPLEVLNTAFWTAFLLAGNSDAAEAAVLDGIAAAQFGKSFGKGLLTETVSSAIRRSEGLDQDVNGALSLVPEELRRVALLATRLRHCFVLRILLGATRESCIEVLHLGAQDFDDALRVGLENLALIAVGSTRSSTQI